MTEETKHWIEKNHIQVPNPVNEVRIGLYEPIGIFCGPVAPGRKGLVISWPPPHGWNEFTRINIVMSDKNFEVFCKAVKRAWYEWTGEKG